MAQQYDSPKSSGSGAAPDINFGDAFRVILGIILVGSGGFLVAIGALLGITPLFPSRAQVSGVGGAFALSLLGGLMLVRFGLRTGWRHGRSQSLRAALSAFQRRAKRWVLFRATLTFLVIASLGVGAFVLLNNQSDINAVARWIETANALNPTAGVTDSIMALAPSMAVMVVGLTILAASFEAACLRWLVRDETAGLFGLTLGADTWRVWLGYWLWVTIYIAGASCLAIIRNFHAVGPSANTSELATALVSITFLYVLIRLEPAAATSIGARRFAFLDAWKVTRGRFLELLSSQILLLVVLLLAYVAIASLVFIVLAVAGLLPARGQPPNFAIVASLNAMVGLVLIMCVVSVFGICASAARAALDDGLKSQPPKRAAKPIQATRTPEPSPPSPSVLPVSEPAPRLVAAPARDAGEFDRCPNCGATQHKHGADLELAVYECACGKRYCDNCSAGGLVTLPFCPGARTAGGLVSSQHPSDRRRVGPVSSSANRARVAAEESKSATSAQTPDRMEQRTRMSDQEMVKRLVQLAQYYADGGLSANNPALVEEVEDIGRELDRRGGLKEMRRVFSMVPPMVGKRTVEGVWDGVGDWLG